MPESSGEGLSLSAAAEQLGLGPVTHWGPSVPLYRKGNARLTEQDLAKSYNAADLYLTTSLVERFIAGVTKPARPSTPDDATNPHQCDGPTRTAEQVAA
jgi:hypothetical protein